MRYVERFIRLYEAKQRFVIFDVETVGPWNNPVIVEIGAVEAGINYARAYQTFQKILRFRPNSWEPYRRELNIHLIPPQEIENGEDRTSVLREFLKFVEGAILICHTCFDVQTLQKNLPEKDFPDALASSMFEEFIDSCQLAKDINPQLPSYALASLAEYFHIENPQAHRALADALTTKRVVACLVKEHYQNCQANKEI